jgi:hypothetical protein
MAVARQRPTSATVFAGLMLVTAGLVIGFALAQIVSVGDPGAAAVQDQTPVGVRTPGQFVGLSPDDRQVLSDAGQSSSGSSSARFGGLSPDDRQPLSDAGQSSSGSSSARFGGLSPDDRDALPLAP